MDAASHVGEALLKTQFVAKSWGDIRKKLGKLDEWQDWGLQELLREVQKEYVKRDEEKTKSKGKNFCCHSKKKDGNDPKYLIIRKREETRILKNRPRRNPFVITVGKKRAPEM